MQEVLQHSIDTAADGLAYRNYQIIRPWVLDMLSESRSQSDVPSEYWRQETAGFEYMLDASPLIVEKMRDHCYHLTGLHSYEYRDHHGTRKQPFETKFQALRKLDDKNRFIAENPALGGFGHDVNGHMVNIDTLKFYECLIAMDMRGALHPFESSSDDRKLVIEIGAGWGGFGYQFKTLFPNVTYVVVDLPQTLLFSSLYLRTLFPDASVFMYGDQPISTLTEEARNYDFIFLPHFAMDELELKRPDLGANICSYQEMTSEQVDGYARKLWEMECPSIYSLNRDRSPYNDQLSTVTSILSEHYNVERVDVLPVSYNQVNLPAPPAQPSLLSHVRHPRRTLRSLKQAVMPVKTNGQALGVRAYRHLIGNRLDSA